MKCPKCGCEIDYFKEAGKKGGKVKSEKKAEHCRNARKEWFKKKQEHNNKEGE